MPARPQDAHMPLADHPAAVGGDQPTLAHAPKDEHLAEDRVCETYQEREDRRSEKVSVHRAFAGTTHSAGKRGTIPLTSQLLLSGAPVGWPALEVRNREDDQFRTLDAVHDGEREALGNDAPCAQLPRCPKLRMRGCKSGCRLDGLAKPSAKALMVFLVVRNLFEELVLRFLEEANRFHCVRRRAAAKTSSAGISLASPRSYFAIRSAISASHAA